MVNKLAKVRDIQTNGLRICYTLKDVCRELLDPANENVPEKMNIAVILQSGYTKHITLNSQIKQEKTAPYILRGCLLPYDFSFFRGALE